jgi:hypothetical protein
MMTTIDVCSEPELMTAEWLTVALTEAGVANGATVTEVDFGGFIGTGQTGRNARLSLTWSDPTGRPASVVAKIPSADPNARASAFGSHMIIRWAMPLSLADLNQRGYVAPTGPVLDATDWARVMVTLARSDDGNTLELGLSPRNDDSDTGVVDLAFSQLAPGVTYRAVDTAGMERGTCRGDIDGRATMNIDLDGPVRLRVVPS